MSSNLFDTDVIVIGSGPTGGTAALVLATCGIGVTVATYWNWTANSPRAHITNQRTMEVLRDLGVEEDARKYEMPWEAMGDTLFATSFAGEEIARLRTWGTGDERVGDYVRGSPCAMADISHTWSGPAGCTTGPPGPHEDHAPVERPAEAANRFAVQSRPLETGHGLGHGVDEDRDHGTTVETAGDDLERLREAVVDLHAIGHRDIH